MTGPPLLASLPRPWRGKARLTPGARRRLSAQILAKTLDLGASLAGIAYGATLRTSPSHRGAAVRWPADARSAVVLALVHRSRNPDLDRWDGQKGGTPGNRALIRISAALVHWLRQRHGILAHSMPYQIAQGGIFVKDAAVMAGLGALGRNNLVVTPAFGPRIRLRVVLTRARLAPTGPRYDFEPCAGCAAPCQAACPQAAFRSGAYDRQRCLRQMAADQAAAPEGIRYCRRCELGCPVGMPAAADFEDPGHRGS